MQSGELIVTGKNSISIPLDRRPAEVKARFKNEIEMIPCNQQDVDYIEYSIETNHHPHGVVLVIKWSVSGVREVVWEASF